MSRSGGAVTWGMAWPRIRFGPLPMVVLVAVAVFCASCGGSPSATGGSSTTSSVRSTTTSTNAQASGVLAAYRAEQAAFEQAVQHADPTLPALAQTMTGAQLDSVRRSLVADQTNGIVGRGSVQLNPKVAWVRRNPGACLGLRVRLVRARLRRHRETSAASNSTTEGRDPSPT